MLKCFSYFYKKTGFDISCKLSPFETICRECQNLFSGKDKKIIISLSAELALRVVMVKSNLFYLFCKDHPLRAES